MAGCPDDAADCNPCYSVSSPVQSQMREQVPDLSSQISVLDENKGTADVNTAKGICLEHLGTISSKVYKMAQSSKAPSGSVEGDAPHHLMPMKQVCLPLS